MLIIENQHQRALFRHVSSEQFHRRLQVVVGICTKSDLCASYLAFAVGIRNLDNCLDLHTGAEWDLRRAKRAAGMRAALAKDFQKKFGDISRVGASKVFAQRTTCGGKTSFAMYNNFT